jgi:phage terminase large subunit-like protein
MVMLNALNEDKMLLMRKLFETDIESFGQFFFKNHLKLETPEFHREIYDLYENREIYSIGIAAPRAHAKSTITDLVYLAWEIVHNKCRFALLVSDTYSQATLFLESLKAEFESNEKLIAFYGDMVSKSWSESEIVVNDILIKAVGAGMKVRGLKYLDARPDLIIVDDLENDELVESAERRDKLERWFNGALIPSMSKNGRVVVIGTILHYDSLLSKIIDPTKYLNFKKKVYRAITDTGALWPEHLNVEELEAIKQDYLSKGQGYLFYQEYMNDPVSDENRKFKLEKFKYIEDENELLAKETNTFITLDRAYSLDKTADFTGIIVNSVDRDNNWNIRLAERFKGTEKELIDKIFALFMYFNPVKFGIEQKAFEYTIKPALDDEMRKRNVFFLVESLKDLGRAKTVRIEGLIPRFETGSIFLKRDQTDLIDELIKFPRAKHDDLIDALSYQLEIAEAGSPSQNKARIFYPTRKKIFSFNR